MLTSLERQVLDLIDSQEVIVLSSRMVQTESWDSNEAKMVDIVADYLAAAKISIEVHEVSPHRSNVVARVGSGTPKRTLVYSGHMDSAPPGDPATWREATPFSGLVRDGRLYGRGASDDKGGLAGMVVALSALKKSGVELDGELVLAAVCGEVQGNIGARALAAQGLRGDFGVVAEYSYANQLATCYRGALWSEVVLTGRSAHTGRPKQGVDTIKAAVNHVIPVIWEIGEQAPPHPLLQAFEPIIGVNMIKGGSATNMIPDRCEMVLDARFPPSVRVHDLETRIAEGLRRCETLVPGLKTAIRRLHAVEGYEVASDHPIVRLLRRTIGELTKQDEAPVMGKAGFSDANVFVEEVGFPAVAYGPGNSTGHGPDEYVDVHALATAAKVYSLFAMRFLS